MYLALSFYLFFGPFDWLYCRLLIITQLHINKKKKKMHISLPFKVLVHSAFHRVASQHIQHSHSKVEYSRRLFI